VFSLILVCCFAVCANGQKDIEMILSSSATVPGSYFEWGPIELPILSNGGELQLSLSNIGNISFALCLNRYVSIVPFYKMWGICNYLRTYNSTNTTTSPNGDDMQLPYVYVESGVYYASIYLYNSTNHYSSLSLHLSGNQCLSPHIGTDCAQAINNITLGEPHQSSLEASSWDYYSVDLPAKTSNLTIIIDSDAPIELYARPGNIPILPGQYHNDDAHYTSVGEGANVTMLLEVPSGGLWALGIRNNNNNNNNATVNYNITIVPPYVCSDDTVGVNCQIKPIDLSGNTSVIEVSKSPTNQSWYYYSFDIDPYTPNLRVSVTSLDSKYPAPLVYLRHLNVPTTQAYDVMNCNMFNRNNSDDGKHSHRHHQPLSDNTTCSTVNIISIDTPYIGRWFVAINNPNNTDFALWLFTPCPNNCGQHGSHNESNGECDVEYGICFCNGYSGIACDNAEDTNALYVYLVIVVVYFGGLLVCCVLLYIAPLCKKTDSRKSINVDKNINAQYTRIE